MIRGFDEGKYELRGADQPYIWVLPCLFENGYRMRLVR